MVERTFSIIKPDAVERNLQGEVLAMIQGAGLKVVAMKMIHLTKAQAEGFYAVHRERPFFDSLTTYMCSGPVVCSVLEGENAISRYREIMGAVVGNPGEDVFTLDAALGRVVTPEDVRRISWLSLHRLNTDAVQLQHDRAGVARLAVPVKEIAQ